MWTTGFQNKAKLLLETEQDKLHQRTPNLWNKIVSVTRQSVSKLMPWFWIGLSRHGINKEALMQINNEWSIVLEITMLDGTRTHCICICNGWIYDSNSNIILRKSIINLDLYAQLHVAGFHNNFASTSMAYYFLPTINYHWLRYCQVQLGLNIRKCNSVTSVLVRK